MVYKKIIKLCHERKEKLTKLLDNDSLNLKNDRVNQIKGAIDEIELFLMTLHTYEDTEVKKNYTNSINLPIKSEGVFSKFSKIFQKEKFKNNSSQFSLSDSYKNQQLKRKTSNV